MSDFLSILYQSTAAISQINDTRTNRIEDLVETGLGITSQALALAQSRNDNNSGVVVRNQRPSVTRGGSINNIVRGQATPASRSQVSEQIKSRATLEKLNRVTTGSFSVNYRNSATNKSERFFFSLLPAIEINSRVSGGGMVPEVKRGIVFKSMMNHKKFNIVGGAPLYQNLGVNQQMVQLVGSFIGNERSLVSNFEVARDEQNRPITKSQEGDAVGSVTDISRVNDPESQAVLARSVLRESVNRKAGAPNPEDIYSNRAVNLNSYKTSRDFNDEVVLSGREVQLQIVAATSIVPDEHVEIFITGFFASMRYMFVRSDRTYYAMDFVITRHGEFSESAGAIIEAQKAKKVEEVKKANETTEINQERDQVLAKLKDVEKAITDLPNNSEDQIINNLIKLDDADFNAIMLGAFAASHSDQPLKERQLKQLLARAQSVEKNLDSTKYLLQTLSTLRLDIKNLALEGLKRRISDTENYYDALAQNKNTDDFVATLSMIFETNPPTADGAVSSDLAVSYLTIMKQKEKKQDNKTQPNAQSSIGQLAASLGIPVGSTFEFKPDNSNSFGDARKLQTYPFLVGSDNSNSLQQSQNQAPLVSGFGLRAPSYSLISQQINTASQPDSLPTLRELFIEEPSYNSASLKIYEDGRIENKYSGAVSVPGEGIVFRDGSSIAEPTALNPVTSPNYISRLFNINGRELV